jgi:hypothetical protein
MRWIIALSVPLGLAALARAFVMNARLIRRDVNKRFDAIRDRLESSANSVVDELFKRNGVGHTDSAGD